MTQSFYQQVRIQLLGVNDEGTLNDEYVKLMVDDATSRTGISSEGIALRYYTCYLIALNWESIGAVESREGVKYRTPDSDKYYKLYKDIIEDSLATSDIYTYAGKVSTNDRFEVDTTNSDTYGEMNRKNAAK